MRADRLALAAAAVATTLAVTSPARAQLRWDASAQAGPVVRAVSDAPAGADGAGLGGEALLAAHVALLPLVRVGPYATFDATRVGEATRVLAGGGLRAKVFAPLPAGNLRAWLFVGFGVLGAWSPAKTVQIPVTGPAGTSLVEAEAARAGGRLLEVPVGAGAAWKVWGPWSFTAELGLRIGFAHGGSLYDPPGRGLSGPAPLPGWEPPQGLDRFGVGLTLGAQYDR